MDLRLAYWEFRILKVFGHISVSSGYPELNNAIMLVIGDSNFLFMANAGKNFFYCKEANALNVKNPLLSILLFMFTSCEKDSTLLLNVTFAQIFLHTEGPCFGITYRKK